MNFSGYGYFLFSQQTKLKNRMDPSGTWLSAVLLLLIDIRKYLYINHVRKGSSHKLSVISHPLDAVNFPVVFTFKSRLNSQTMNSRFVLLKEKIIKLWYLSQILCNGGRTYIVPCPLVCVCFHVLSTIYIF